MEPKVIPNRRQITLAIMKGSDLDGRMVSLKEKVSQLSEGNGKEVNVLIGAVYKSITDTAFFLGKSVARTLDSVQKDDDLLDAAERLRSVLELTNSYMDGVASVLKNGKSGTNITDYDFEDIMEGLDFGETEADGSE